MGSPFSWVLFIIILINIPKDRRAETLTAQRILKDKRINKENNIMKELVNRMIGKECVIYTVTQNGYALRGVIKEMDDGGIIVERKSGESEIVNLNFVTRIRELPISKSGKIKSIIID